MQTLVKPQTFLDAQRSRQQCQNQHRPILELDASPRGRGGQAPRALAKQKSKLRRRSEIRPSDPLPLQEMVVTKICETSPQGEELQSSVAVEFSRAARKQGEGDPGAAQGMASPCLAFLRMRDSCKERFEARQAKPRARLAITAKSKPPTGDSHDFTMVFTDVQGGPQGPEAIGKTSSLLSLREIFVCIRGSTSLWEANPRAMELALRLHDATIRQVLAKHSGYEARLCKCYRCCHCHVRKSFACRSQQKAMPSK